MIMALLKPDSHHAARSLSLYCLQHISRGLRALSSVDPAANIRALLASIMFMSSWTYVVVRISAIDFACGSPARSPSCVAMSSSACRASVLSNALMEAVLRFPHNLRAGQVWPITSA